MKKSLALVGLALSFAYADPPKIDMPVQPSEETTASPETAAGPISVSVPDPTNKEWQEYDNRIVKVHLHIRADWLMMEIKETRESGTVSFTLSRHPMITFSVDREPIQGNFDLYISSPSLTPLYPTGYKRSITGFAGRRAYLIRGKAEDGRMDESYFSTDGQSMYQVSFSAPEENWKDAAPQFAALKETFRWLH